MKYRVELKDTSIYEFEIDAEDEDEAVDIAWDKLTAMAEHEKQGYLSDCDGEASAEEIG